MLEQIILDALPEVLLGAVILVSLLVGAFFGDKSQKFLSFVAMITLAVIIYILADVKNLSEQFIFNDFYLSNPLIILSKVILLSTGIFIFILYISQIYPKDSRMNSFEFPIIILLSMLGMMIMISANDFLSLYLGLELQSLCFYVMAAFERGDSKSNEAGVKYFVLGALASCILLYGVSLVYGFVGTTDFETIKQLFEKVSSKETVAIGFIVGMVFIIIGFCFKISAAPFHMWVPDVYQGSPTIVTAIFATMPKIAAIVIITRILMNPFGTWLEEWRQIIILVSVISMFVGAFGAIYQTNIKRLFAYSSIGHVGYLLMGVASSSKDGLIGVLLYISLYVIMTLGVFASIMMMNRDRILNQDITMFKGLHKTNPIMAFCIAVLMFSMAGIPPFAGFYGKFYVFKAAIESNHIYFVVAGVLASVVAAYYYLRIIKFMYFDEASVIFDKGSKGAKFVLCFSSFVNLLYFLVPSVFIQFCYHLFS